MAIVTAPGRFCYLECDEPGCGRKIYQYHEEIVQELARLSGWKNRGDSWTCPGCAEKTGSLRIRPLRETGEGRRGSAEGSEVRHPSGSAPRRRGAQLSRWP